MTVYLSSPSNGLQAHLLRDMPVLLSFANWRRGIRDYVPSFSSTLLDSGAYSALSIGKVIDLEAYADWSLEFPEAVAVAGLDCIDGDWRQSLKNYARVGFPTFHDTDPPELLTELLPLALARGGWLGIGLKPPRHGKETWLRDTLERIPAELHVHGWALGGYRHLARLDSIDSTNWFRDAFKFQNAMPWLTPAEALEIVVKRFRRAHQGLMAPPQTAFDLQEWDV